MSDLTKHVFATSQGSARTGNCLQQHRDDNTCVGRQDARSLSRRRNLLQLPMIRIIPKRACPRQGTIYFALGNKTVKVCWEKMTSCNLPIFDTNEKLLATSQGCQCRRLGTEPSKPGVIKQLFATSQCSVHRKNWLQQLWDAHIFVCCQNRPGLVT